MRPNGLAAWGAHRQPAQIMVLFALTVVALMAMIGLVVDGGNIYVQRRTAQSSADAAALAGTRALRNATSPDQVGAISPAIVSYAAENNFGVPPRVPCAYF